MFRTFIGSSPGRQFEHAVFMVGFHAEIKIKGCYYVYVTKGHHQISLKQIRFSSHKFDVTMDPKKFTQVSKLC
jgi:hypothetical protein